ncbi:MAG: helix-turn-helix domain-containing protein [Candidatus Brocadiaceae bacterium]|jgi:DNA-binding IclR family transcriptional regulator
MAASRLIQSVLRALDVLVELAGEPEGVALKELAGRLGLKPPTAHKVLRTLAARGFVERHTGPVRYALGPVVFDLARARWEGGLMERAAEVVRDLAERFPAATVTYSRHIGEAVVAVLRTSPERPGFIQRDATRSMHPYGTASALVFQAYWTEEERAAYRRRHPFWEHGAHLWDTIEEVEGFLQEVRSSGYAAPRLSGKAILPLAVPVFGAGGVLHGALGIALPAGLSERRAEAIDALVESAGRLSSAGEQTVEQQEAEHAGSRGR